MKTRFLSLKWQAVLSMSLILIFGIGLITYYGKSNLERNYLNQRENVFQSRHQAVTTTLKVMQLQMMHLASYMQGLAGQPDGVDATKNMGLVSTLERNWDQMNFEWGIDAIVLYRDDGGIVSAFGMPISNQLVPMEWVIATGNTETPTAQVWCYNSCWQVVVVPVLLDNSGVGILMLVQSLADAVLQFQSSTAADVGILVPQDDSSDMYSSDVRALDDWYHNVIALTGAPQTYSILKDLAADKTMEVLTRARAVRTWHQQDIEVSLIPLTDLPSSRGATLVVMDDVSGETQHLRSTITNLFLAAFGILVAAEAALLWMLWSPMSRLRDVAQVLPKLAKGDRSGIMKQLRIPAVKPRLRNEIHDLFQSAALLSDTLEELDSTVKNRTRGLKMRSRELLEQRNFVTTLLDNVHTVILTQDANGAIHMLNAEGSRILGDKGNTTFFIDQLDEADRRRVKAGLAELLSGLIQDFRHENIIVSAEDGPLYIEWYHTLLPATTGEHSNAEKLVLTVGTDLTARKHAETNLAWLADNDPLTELLNRRGFQLEFDKILKQVKRRGNHGAIIFLDIDQFKTVNDTSGHPAGDWLLCDIAQQLKEAIRDVDTLARIGGDEFAIIIEDAGEKEAIAVAEKLCSLIGGAEVVLNNRIYRITISIGIALFPNHGTTVDELMANVDLAMYKAKSAFNARSNWYIYSTDAPDRKELHERVDWKARIQKALDEKRYVLYYQPIIDLSNYGISHYEALVRMLDEEGKIVPPGMFIPVAEKTGLIYEIDQLVLNQAISELKTFHERGEKIKIAVNLSATAISKMDFIDNLEQLVSEHNVDRSCLIFELTETSAVEDIVTTANVIGACRKLGFKFALDDFGAGFASWFYLRQLPVDFVKIDGSFVRNLAHSEEDRLFVKAINEVAKGLGKETIAEFVENAESLELLKQMGVDYAQGYFVGKPAPGIQEIDLVKTLQHVSQN